MGPNGVGKSTFLDLLTGKAKPDSGRVVLGQTVQFGYYAQAGMEGKEDKRVIDIVRETAEVVRMQDGREVSASQFLQYFQFSPSTQYNYFSNLSGGERRRLYLLKTLMSNPNFLVLDEPTNDMDLHTLMLIEDFLRHYQGCLLMVSHDRSFLEHLADHIFVFEGNGKVKDWYGTYAQYKEARQRKEREQKEGSRQAGEARGASRLSRTQESGDRVPSRQRATYKQKKEYEELNARIPLLEAEKKALEEILSGKESDPEKISQASARMARILEDLSGAEDRWLELSEIVEG